MRDHRLLFLGILLVLLLGACSSEPAGWTYAPASPTAAAASQSASAAPSVAVSAAPSAGASAAPSAGASAAPSAGASAGPPAPSGGAGQTVTIAAQNIDFSTKDVTAPATGFTLAFDNQDAGTPHDVEIKDASGAKVFQTDIVQGAATKTYPVGPLAPGAYTFICTIHQNMTGNLTVQ